MLKNLKRCVSALLVLAMVLSMACVPGILPVTSAAESAQVNLMTNPGFETRNAIPGWNTSPNPSPNAELSSDYVTDGMYSMQISGKGNWLWSNMTNIKAGTTYELSAQVLADPNVAGDTLVQAFIRFYNDADTKLLQTGAVTLNLTQQKGSWQTITTSGTAPTGATKADVLLVTTGTSTGTVHFDAVKLCETEGANLLANPSFDKIVAVPGWTNYGGDEAYAHTVQTHETIKSGSYALKIVDNNEAGGYQFQSDAIKAEPNVEYTASVEVCGAGLVQLVLRYMNDAGTQVGTQTVASLNATGSWTTLTAVGTAPAGTTNIRVLLCSTGKSTGTAYFDNAFLAKTTDIPVEEEEEDTFAGVIFEDNFDNSRIEQNGIPKDWMGHETGPGLVTYSLDSSIRKGDSGYSLKMEKSHTATRTIYMEKRINVKAGKTYRAELDYYGTATCQFYLQTFADGYTTVDNQNVGKAGQEGKWVHLTNEFVATSDAQIIRIVIGLGGSTTGTVYFDNIKVEEVAKEEQKDISIFADDFEDSTIASGRPTGWVGTTDENVTYALESDVEGMTGQSLKQVKTGTSTRSLYVDIRNYPVKAGKTYRAEMDVFVVPDGTDANIAKGFQFYVVTYTAGHASKVDVQDVGSKAVEGKWVHLTNEITATADAAIIRVQLGMGGKTEGTVYVDNITLIEVGQKEENGNLLSNPSFEDSDELVNWTPNDRTKITISTDHAQHGANAIRIVDDNPSGGVQLWSDKVNITAGAEYTAKAYVYDISGETDVQVYLRYFDVTGKTRIEQKAYTLRTAAGKWQEMSVTLAAPSNAVKADVLVCTTGSAVGMVYFDSVSLMATGEEQPVDPPSGGDTPVTPPPSTPVDPNAIIDETFDNITLNDKGVPAGWQGVVDSQVVYSLDSTIKAGDTGSSLKLYKVDGTTTTRTVYIEKTFTVTPGKYYCLEMDYYGDVICQFYLQTMNGSKIVESQNSGTKGIAGKWVHLKNELVASEAATKVRVTIGLGGNVCGTVYFDNIKLKESDPPVVEEVVDPNLVLQNKLDDATIESNGLPSGWTGTAHGGEYTMQDGNIYLQMTKDEGATVSRTIYKEWTMEIKAGQKYRVEMDYYGGPSCQFYLQLLSGGKVVQTQDKGKMGKETAWIHLSNEFIAKQDAQKIRITLGLGGTITGTVGFDNIRLVEVKEDGDQEIYFENFSNIMLQANTVPKGWYGAVAADVRYKLVDNGQYLQFVKDKVTETPDTLVFEAPVTIETSTTYKVMLDFLGKARGAVQIDLLSGSQVVQSARKSSMGDNALWSALYVQLTAEHNADRVRITISLDSAAIGVFGFDNLRMVIIPPLDLENMVTEIENPSFEETPDAGQITSGWIVSTDKSKFTLTDEQASDGKYSIKIVDDLDDAGSNITSSRIEVVPNAAYMATVDVYGDASAQIYIRFLNKYGVVLANGSATMQKDDGFWYTMKAQSTAPADAKYAVILLATTRKTTGRVYFDNIKVEMTISDSTEGGSTPNVQPEGGWKLAESGHPRLFYTADTLKDIKDFAKDTSKNAFGYTGAANYRELIQGAESYLDETSIKINYIEKLVTYDMVNFPDPNYMEELQEVPEGYNGGFTYPYLSAYGVEIKKRLQTLSLAYALTGDTRYADRAIEISMKMCEWEAWAQVNHWAGSVGQNTGQDTVYFVTGTSTVYDICYDRLTAEQRKTLKSAIVTKGLDLIMEDTGILINHNYYLSRISALIVGACAVAESAEEAEEYLTRGYNYSKWYLDNLYTSGDQEGFMYNSHQIEELVESLDNMSRVTGNNDLITHEYFTNLLVDWVLYFMAPGNGSLMPISDSPFNPYFFTTMSILNKEWGNEKAGYILYYSQMKSSAFKSLLYTSKNPAIADAEEIYKAVVHIEELGYGGLRSGWDADDIFLSIIANDSDMHHNHYDQNSIIFATDSNLLLNDPGYANSSGGAEGVFGKYHGHNTIFVDGEPQQELGQGKLSTIVNSTLYGHIKGSAADAYGVDRYGKVLSQFDRHAIMINHGDRPYFIIFDELESGVERTFTWNMYTGGWNALEVEGVPLETNGVAVEGNKVAISTSGGMLFTEFVAGEPLKISTFTHDGGGPNLQVDSEKSTSTEFMTILSKNYGESANKEYSFIPLLDQLNKVEYKTSSKNPVITKSVTVQSVPLFFFRGDKVGDYIKLPFVAEESGEFELILKTCTSYNYGIYKIYIDDEYVATYDGCAIKVELNYFSLGQHQIEAGEHTLKLELIGTSSLTDGMLISASSIIFSSGQTLGESPIYTQEVYDTDKVLGAKIFHTEYNSDIVLLNRGTGAFTAGGVTTDAKQASVIGLMADGYMEGFAASDVAIMTFDGKTLVQASEPVTVAADFRGTASYEISTDKAQTVKLYAGEGVLSAVVDGKAVEITVADGVVSVPLTAGSHTVVLKMQKTQLFEYLNDGSTITTIFDQDGNVVRYHAKNMDGTELLIENGKVLLNIYIEEKTALMIREETAEDGTLTTTYYDITKNVDRIQIDRPDGSRTEIDYQSDGTIVTNVWSAQGVVVENMVQNADGSATKTERREDATITTQYDTNGKILRVIGVYKNGTREETIYQDDGSMVTTKYAKGGKIASVYTKNADGTAILVENLDDGGTCTTTYDAQGNVVSKIIKDKNGTIVQDVLAEEAADGNIWLWVGIGAAVAAAAICCVLATILIRKKKKANEAENA